MTGRGSACCRHAPGSIDDQLHTAFVIVLMARAGLEADGSYSFDERDIALGDVLFGIIAMLPLAAGFAIGRRYGRWTGVAAGLGLYVAFVVGLVTTGHGY